MNNNETEIVKVMERGQVTIPKNIRISLNISQGTKLFVTKLDDNNILFSALDFNRIQKSTNSKKYFGFFANRRNMPITQKEMDEVVKLTVIKKFKKKNVDLS